MAVFSITKKENNDWVKSGNVFLPCNGKVSLVSDIIPGIWKIVPSPNQMDNRLGIVYQGEKFELKFDKVYSVGGEDIIEIIKNTWKSKIFRENNKNLCSIFNGLKGTGKTIAAKILCNYYAETLPVFIVNDNFEGRVVDFIQNLDFECVVLIDEAEKTFCDKYRTDLLKICDGVYSNSSKIILMTMNSLKIDDNLIDRPGRVRYIKNFGNLPEKTCREYLKDNLPEKKDQEDVYNYINSLKIITIDILKNIIDEFKIHGNLETTKKFMNLPTSRYDFSVLLFPCAEDSKDFEKIRKIVVPVRNKLKERFWYWIDQVKDYKTYIAEQEGFMEDVEESKFTSKIKSKIIPSVSSIAKPILNNKIRDGKMTLKGVPNNNLVEENLPEELLALVGSDKKNDSEDTPQRFDDIDWLKGEYKMESTFISIESPKIYSGLIINDWGKVISDPDKNGFFWVEYHPSDFEEIRDTYLGNILNTGDKFLCMAVNTITRSSRYMSF